MTAISFRPPSFSARTVAAIAVARPPALETASSAEPTNPGASPANLAARSSPAAPASARAVGPSEDVRAALAAARTRADDLQRIQQQTRVKVRDDAKARAREKLTQLAERLRLLRALHGANPKELARQVAQLVRELKAELKTYAEAAKANGESVAPASPAPGAEAPAAVDPALVASPDTAPGTPPPAPPSQSAAEREARIAGAHADLDFIKLVRGFLKTVRQTLTEARIKDGAALIESRSRVSPFRDADEALKDVDQAIEDIEASAKADLPVPGMRVSELA